MAENTKLAKQDTSLATKKPQPGLGLKRGIMSNIAQAEKTIKESDPLSVPNRLGLVFDDSGSMRDTDFDGPKISNAHTAVKNFTTSCNFTDTSICLYPLNKEGKTLTLDYDLLNIFVMGITASGNTPLYTTLKKMIEKESITRAVVFSDGSPTDSKLLGDSENYFPRTEIAKDVVKIFQNKEISIDTIYIGSGHTMVDESEDGMVRSQGYLEMEELAKQTGGIFIYFKDSTSLSKNLKYLAPKYRALLMNEDLKRKISEGGTV